jgi:YbgC/YbaW family acyl-CoA thioester hydrolase
MKKAYEFRTQRRVEFADTDCAGIIHFTSYFRYMEEAEHAFFRSLGQSVKNSSPLGEVGFPRLSATCEFLAPATFEDVLDVHLWVERKGRTSLTYTVVFSKGGKEVARGRTRAVCCRFGSDRTFHPIPLPEALASMIDEAPYPALWPALESKRGGR